MSKNTSSDPTTHTHQKKSPWTPKPVPPPTADQLGELTLHLQTVLQGGPDALQAAHRATVKHSNKHGEHFEQEWFLLTPYLAQLRASRDGRTRGRASYALSWRPRYLAALAVTGSSNAALRHSRVDDLTLQTHKRDDPDFENQCAAAKTYFVELLHDRVKQRALEGDCEPVFYMGVPCGWVRKFDSRLQIEVLRAHLPNTYKTPGDKPITINNNQSILIMDSDARHKVQEARTLALRRQKERLLLPPAEGGSG